MIGRLWRCTIEQWASLEKDQLLGKFSRHMSAGFAAALRIGDFASGWEKLMERRDRITLVPPPGVKIWKGEASQDETLLVLSEGGVGDEIKMASLFPDLMEETESAYVTVDPRLAPLMRRSFPGIKFIPVMRQRRASKVTIREPWQTTGLPLRPTLPADVYCFAQFCDSMVLAADLLKYWRPNRNSFPRYKGYLVPDPSLREEMRRSAR